MICNAGFGYYGPIDDTPPDVMHRMMDVNYMGTFYGARAALPIFRAQTSGHLIFISSIVGRRGIPLMGGYTATKAAQAGLAESLRAEFAGSPIHVTCVYPISTPTEFIDAHGARLRHKISGLGPTQSVDDVARAIVTCIRRPKPEVYLPAADVPRADDPQCARAGREFVRRCGRRRWRCSVRRSHELPAQCDQRDQRARQAPSAYGDRGESFRRCMTASPPCLPASS